MAGLTRDAPTSTHPRGREGTASPPPTEVKRTYTARSFKDGESFFRMSITNRSTLPYWPDSRTPTPLLMWHNVIWINLCNTVFSVLSVFLVCATRHIKDPVPLIEKSRAVCPGGRFPPSYIHQVIIITGLNRLCDCMFSPWRWPSIPKGRKTPTPT